MNESNQLASETTGLLDEQPPHVADSLLPDVPLRVETADDAYRETLLALLLEGELVAPTTGRSVGEGRPTLERRNHSFEIPNARQRLVASSTNHVRATLAVGRVLWMLAGSDRLEDIHFYESSYRSQSQPEQRKKGVASFSEDGLSVPGSNYGARLFRPAPGVDQVARCIELIRSEPNTRRASMAVYQPEDAGRDSPDIPCTFGILLSPREGVLHLTTVMRSNNAWLLLPYNIFEFTILGEIIASEAGVELGSYHHFSVSMHLYEEDRPKAQTLLSSQALALEPFPPMRSNSLATATLLCKWEARMRHQHRGLGKRDLAQELRRLKSYGDFWEPFGRVVLAQCMVNAGKTESAHEIATNTRGPLGQLLRDELDIAPLAEQPAQFALGGDGLEAKIDRLRDARVEDPKLTGRFHLMMMRATLDDYNPKWR